MARSSIAATVRKVMGRKVQTGQGQAQTLLDVHLKTLMNEALTKLSAARELVSLICTAGLAKPEPPPEQRSGIMVVPHRFRTRQDWVGYWAESERVAKEQTELMKANRDE